MKQAARGEDQTVFGPTRKDLRVSVQDPFVENPANVDEYGVERRIGKDGRPEIRMPGSNLWKKDVTENEIRIQQRRIQRR